MMRILTLAAVLALVGCSGQEQVKEAPASGTEPVVAEVDLDLPEGASKIGEAITVGDPVRLAAVRQNPTAYFDKTILVEADAAAVCQAKGCWLTMSDGEGEPIWVRWSSGCGGKYAFPKDAAGKRILVQGSFYEKEIEAEAAEHLASENDKLNAEDIVGKTFEMNATACVILPGEEEEEGVAGA